MQRDNPRLYELNAGFISPFDKKLVEKNIKVSPFVHLEYIKDPDDKEKVQYYIINDYNQNKQKLEHIGLLNLLRMIKKWTIPDTVMLKEYEQQMNLGFRYSYNSGFLVTETFDLSYVLLSFKLLNYHREIEKDCFFYYRPEIAAHFFLKLKTKVKEAFACIENKQHFVFDVTPLIVFCKDAKAANAFWDDSSTNKPEAISIFTVMKRAIVFDVSALNEAIIESKDFNETIIACLIQLSFYEMGSRIPYWLEIGLADYAVNNYYSYKNDDTVCDEHIYSFKEFDILAFNIVSLHHKNEMFIKQFIAQTKSFVRYVIDTFSFATILIILNELKMFDVSFVEAFKKATGCSFDDIEIEWRGKQRYIIKYIGINNYELHSKKYFDKELYFVENVNQKNQIKIEETDVAILEKLKNNISFANMLNCNESTLPADIIYLGRKLAQIQLLQY